MNPKWQQIRRSWDVACFLTLSHLNCCDVFLGIPEYHKKRLLAVGFKKKGSQLILYTYRILVDGSELSHKAGTFKSSKTTVGFLAICERAKEPASALQHPRCYVEA